MYKLIILLSIFSSLSLVFAQKSIPKPTWINSPEAECNSKTQLCAVGVGTGRLFAQQNALKSLAKAKAKTR
jgi:hypothetical protein